MENQYKSVIDSVLSTIDAEIRCAAISKMSANTGEIRKAINDLSTLFLYIYNAKQTIGDQTENRDHILGELAKRESELIRRRLDLTSALEASLVH